MNKKPVFLWFLYLLRAITFCTLFAFVSEKAYSAYTPSRDCPENAIYVNSSCQCNTGFTQTNNNYTFNSNTKVTNVNKNNYTLASNGYEYTVLLSGLTEQDTQITGQVMLLSSSSNSDLDVEPVPGTDTGSNKCWCRIVEPFETIWKYVNTADSLTSCASKCIAKLNSSSVPSTFGSNGILMNGETCEGNAVVNCNPGYENINNTCTPINYTIAYNLNGGTNYANAPISYNITSATITLGTPTKTNNVFAGWYDNSGFNGDTITKISSGSTGNRNLYAKWTTCNSCNAGTNATCSLSVVNNTCTYTTSCPSGYNISGNGTSVPTCTPINYTITYNLNGGSGCSNTTYTGTTTLCTPNRSGYSFNGWTDSNTSNTYSGGASVTDTNLNLTASWTYVGCNNGYYFANNTCNACDSGYTSDGSTATSTADCYRDCITTDIQHSTAITGYVYQNGTNACTPTSCNTGYAPKAGTPDLMTLIGTSEAGTGVGYKSNSGTGNNANESTYGITNNGEFVTDYGNKGKVHGYAICSTRGVNNIYYGNNNIFESDHFVSNLQDETGKYGADYCYCQLDNYKTSGDTNTISLSTPWVLNSLVGGLNGCDSFCAEKCATSLSSISALKYIAFRTAVFNTVDAGPAMCEIETYDVTYSCGDGATGDAPSATTVDYGASFTPAANTCSKTNYEFAGWVVSNTNPSETKAAGTAFTWNYTEDKTLTAKWTAIECGNNQYFDTVSNSCMYCPTGFTPTADATSIADCVIIAHPGTYLNPNNIDKSITGGYTYIKDGDGYTQQPEFTNAKQNSWKVFFDYGNLSGRAACSDIWAEYGSVNQDTEFSPTTWYGYNCWCDIEEYGDCTVNNRQNCSDTETITTKSKWVSFGYVDDNRCWQDCAGKCANAMEQNEYLRSNALSTIALQIEDCPAGYYCPNTITINYGNMPDSYNNKFECPEQYPDSDKNATNISYCFKACDEKIGFTVSGIDYYGNDVTDTCIYTPNTYTVTYDINYNGGTNPEAASYTVGGSGITLPTVTRTGYTLDGWYTESNGGTKINNPYTPDSNTTLYAHWTEIICDNTQYFDETTNSCIECPAEYPNSVNNKCSIEKSCPALVCPEHSTCSYIGATTWTEYIDTENTEEHCKIRIEDCDEGYTSNGETCSPNTYTVIYDVNGGNALTQSTAEYIVGGNAITLPTVTRTGYTFDGWYTASNGGNKVTSPYTPTGNITLYAHWNKAEFICESGKWYHIGFDDKDKICLYAEKKTSPAIAFANAGEEPYYILLSQDQNLKINNKSDIKMHVYIDGNIYNAYDESVNQ